MKIILIGYRASGKSTVGRLLAGKLGIPFLDTDRLIEETAGRTIAEMVAEEGWSAFRTKETDAIASLEDKQFGVVATGGGAILSDRNTAMLRRMGPVIYLKTPLADLIERLRRSEEKQGRPSLTGGNPAGEAEAVLKDRLPLYEKAADFAMDTDGKNVVRVSDEIYQYLLETGIVSEINKTKKQFKNKQ